MPLKTEAVAEALVSMYSRLGVPEEVLSDLGSQFISGCMQEVSKLLSICQIMTTPYHPMCNGLVENFNGTLKRMLKRLCSEQPRQWHRYIDALLFAYREVPQESTGFAPFELLYGQTVRGPLRILRHIWTNEDKESEVRTLYQYVFELRERLEETLKLAREELEKSQARSKYYYDRGSKQRNLSAGGQVLLLRPTDNNNFLMEWKGPYVIEKRVGLNDYAVNFGGKTKTYHANLLKEYVRREGTVHATTPETGAAALELVGVAIIEADGSYMICSNYDIRHAVSSPYHPQANGSVERLNRSIGTALDLAKVVSSQQTDWPDKLPDSQLAYNSANHETIHTSPFQVLFMQLHGSHDG